MSQSRAGVHTLYTSEQLPLTHRVWAQHADDLEFERGHDQSL